jgi:SPP1 gp7 family putative phage head morphogenesis protein
VARPRRRLRRAPRPSSPRALEASYARALRGLNRDLVGVVARALAPHLARAARLEREAREDADREWFADIDWSLIRVRLGRIVGRGGPLVDAFGRRLSRWNHANLTEILRIDLTLEPPAVTAALAAMRAENVNLITSIADRLLADVQEVVRESTTRGTRVETLARQIRERYAVSDSRADLIARDQTLKANADLTRLRHEDAGVSRYVWSTSRDERVRPMHADLEGRVFSWSAPPVTNERGDRNHPGGDFQCRCVAIPVLDD